MLICICVWWLMEVRTLSINGFCPFQTHFGHSNMIGTKCTALSHILQLDHCDLCKFGFDWLVLWGWNTDKPNCIWLKQIWLHLQNSFADRILKVWWFIVIKNSCFPVPSYCYISSQNIWTSLNALLGICVEGSCSYIFNTDV